MNFEQAIRYPTSDPNWVGKVLKAAAWILLIVTSPATIGYTMEAARRVSRYEEGLPEWDDFGGYWIDGFRFILTGFVYSLPFTIFSIILAIVLGGDGDSASLIGSLLARLVSCLGSFVVSLFIPAVYLSMLRNNSWGAGFDFSTIGKFLSSDLKNYALLVVFGYVLQLLGGLGVLACFVGVFFTTAFTSICGAHLYGQMLRNSKDPAIQ